MQSNEELLNRIRQMAQEVSAREGCMVYDVEFGGGGPAGRTLRVYIDKEGASEQLPDLEADLNSAAPGADEAVESAGVGVSVEDCSNVSRGLNELLDTQDVIPGGAYNLEVSSPGLERVLRERWHFEKVIGKTISLKSFSPLIDFNPERNDLAKARTLEGELTGVDEKGVRVLSGKSDVFVPYESITKSHLVFDFDAALKARALKDGGEKNSGGKNPNGKKPNGKSRR